MPNHESNNLIRRLDTRVVILTSDEWEALQREWKQSSDLFIPNTPNTEDKKEGSTSEDQNPEDPPPTKEIPSKPASQSNEKKE
ncbi:hypothetical protein PVK06_008723 [Gossypium arboreum]|uniref:Uncharacterized protein n=1 Tax=Gossypium arboreum TaxID=29729 RepID=A0ABR0QKW4_GOSAR|nr:hypothetical protein PVK06_008723 [Gossypium arboreum]